MQRQDELFPKRFLRKPSQKSLGKGNNGYFPYFCVWKRKFSSADLAFLSKGRRLSHRRQYVEDVMELKKSSLGLRLTGLLLLGVLVFLGSRFFSSEKNAPKVGLMLAPVRIAKVLVQDVPLFHNGLGTVLASSDVLVKSRVTGQLIAIHFHEGQHVKKGDLLAEIDPRPFVAALNEAKGKLSSDEAQLKNAQRDLSRYASLVKGDFVERQKYDTQAALVSQLKGAVASDKAAVENARLQLEYSRITAPSSGRVGLRKVDVGNQITSSDSTGIVRITESSPCDVIFTLPETVVPTIIQALRTEKDPAKLPVQAWDREQKKRLALGSLLSLDNEINVETGTVRLKARFSNEDQILYPNQFVNARIRLSIQKNAVTVPAAAIQVGSKGRYVFVYEDDKGDTGKKEKAPREKQAREGSVHMRDVEVGLETASLVVVEKGLESSDIVVIDGIDRLKDGTKVRVAAVFATPRAEPLE